MADMTQQPKERPIIFSAPMVRALLAGTKTQTRRAVKPQPPDNVRDAGVTVSSTSSNGVWCWLDSTELEDAGCVGDDFRCPYGVPGDRLWVRETFKPHSLYNDLPPSNWPRMGKIFYAADDSYSPSNTRWRSPIHMPRWASRLTLELTAVRVERLQDITERDATAEGTPHSLRLAAGRSAIENYAHLWDTINGDGAWDANPWVWVLEFKRVA